MPRTILWIKPKDDSAISLEQLGTHLRDVHAGVIPERKHPNDQQLIAIHLGGLADEHKVSALLYHHHYEVIDREHINFPYIATSYIATSQKSPGYRMMIKKYAPNQPRIQDQILRLNQRLGR